MKNQSPLRVFKLHTSDFEKIADNTLKRYFDSLINNHEMREIQDNFTHIIK